jgi:hypothetical protein
MPEDEKERQLEAMLDSLLSTYSAAEPRPGLETRLRAVIKAQAVKGRRTWMLALAVAAAVVVVAMLAQLRSPRPSVHGNVVTSQDRPQRHPGAVLVLEPIPPFRSAKVRRTVNRGPRPIAPAADDNQLLLRVVNAMPSADNLIIAHERLYLKPTPQPEPEPALESPTSALSVSIQDLDVQSIEIKELTSANSADSKGNLR